MCFFRFAGGMRIYRIEGDAGGMRIYRIEGESLRRPETEQTEQILSR
jgi:hypothetical protein